MFDNIKPFQMVVVALCVIGAISGVLIFAFGGGKPDQTENIGEEVVIWGVADSDLINGIIKDINGPIGKYINASYEGKNPETFNQEVLEAIASGKGPDVVLMSLDNIFFQKSRMTTIPFSAFDERTFKDSFIEEGELFRLHDGYLAIPFAVDPLVMYWNRDIFTAKNQPTAPAYWDTIVSVTPLFSEVAADHTVSKSAISLGDYRNINHAKEILATLLFQVDTPITSLTYIETSERENLLPMLTNAAPAINFYTQFANPLSKEYTWNRSLPNSLDAFVFGDLAMYIGFGSEAGLIKAKNPNLNFDMVVLPQQRSSTLPITYGKLYGLAILSSSDNKTGSLNAISRITGKDFQQRFSQVSGLPPVRRDLLSNPPADGYSPVLYKSALYSKGWLDPEPSKTDGIFRQIIESVIAGRDTTSEVIKTAEDQLKLLLEEFNNKNNEE